MHSNIQPHSIRVGAPNQFVDVGQIDPVDQQESKMPLLPQLSLVLSLDTIIITLVIHLYQHNIFCRLLLAKSKMCVFLLYYITTMHSYMHLNFEAVPYTILFIVKIKNIPKLRQLECNLNM